MKVLVVDDHPLARRGLRMIVAEAFGAVECAEAGDAVSARDLAVTFAPDLLLLDMHMPGDVTAPALCRAMRQLLPHARIVMVTAFDKSSEIRDCLLAGADGCLLKDTSETDMAASLRTAMAGAPALDSRVAVQLARELTVHQMAPSGLHLTSRERQVLDLLAEGRSNRAIARQLALSEATVKAHVSRLMTKLNASSRLEAVIHASAVGLI
jgi:two-component system nitrate/nitrite response regulator NarL